ncbi:MAG TPA: hypothetical protein VL947_01185 [Cytophagales bacterium]|nr:hypothetical protein [Cytophagales bacterium]
MKTLFISAILIGLTTIYAQKANTTFKDAQEIKRRTLLLVLPENNKVTLKGYIEEDSTFGKLYTEDIEGQRAALKKAVLRFWTFTDSVVVVSSQEAKALQKNEPKKYAVMKIGENTQDRVYIHSHPEPPQAAWSASYGELVYDHNMRYNLRMLGVTTLVIGLPGKAIEVHLPKVSPSEGDFIYAVSQMNYILSYVLQSEEHSSNKLLRKQEEAKAQNLMNKTLLLDAQELGCTNDEIKKVYPYPFKIVNYRDIEVAIMRKDTDYMMITGSRIDPLRTTYLLSNTGDGTIYYNFTEPTFNYGESQGYAIAVLYPSLNAAHLRKIGKIK